MKITALATLVATLVLSLNAHAGATNIVLECKAADGSIALSGDVPGDMADFSLEARLPKATAKLVSDWDDSAKQNPLAGQVSVIKAFKKGVFTVRAESTSSKASSMIQIFALPKTVKVKPLPYGYEAHFTAQLTIWQAPRQEDQAQVSCSAIYNL